jgi:CRISPR-associated protein Cst2
MKNIIGFILVDAPHSALNNAGTDVGARTDNTVAVKKIVKKGERGYETYPYVSAQALRYWWRDTLKERCSWKISPIERQSKIAFTAANPFKYDDDDIFGYMRAQGKKEGGTVTRISPLKCSPLISICPSVPVDDYGVMARQEGDPVPYEHQFYSTVLKGIFSLDIDRVGRFTLENRAGHLNITEHMKDEWEKAGAKEKDGVVELPEDIRLKRIKDCLRVLPYLFGGAKQTLHLTDVTPKFLVLGIIKGGNHPFMNIGKNDDGVPKIDFEALKEALHDYKDEFIGDIYIGKRKGFMDNMEDGLKNFVNKINGDSKFGHKIHNTTINEAVDMFVNQISL